MAYRASPRGLQGKNQRKFIKTVDNLTVNRHVREHSLNKKFHGTWVTEGLTDSVTKSSLARSFKQPDLIEEIVKADHKADGYLDRMEKTENFSWVFKDPPLELGRYYNLFCQRNGRAYRDYKTMGIKKLASDEIDRQILKEQIQSETEKLGIDEADTLKYKNLRDRQAMWSKIVPEEY